MLARNGLFSRRQTRVKHTKAYCLCSLNIEILTGKKIRLYLPMSCGGRTTKPSRKPTTATVIVFPRDNAASETPMNPKATTSTQCSNHLAQSRLHLFHTPLSSSQTVDLERLHARGPLGQFFGVQQRRLLLWPTAPPREQRALKCHLGLKHTASNFIDCAQPRRQQVSNPTPPFRSPACLSNPLKNPQG